MLLWLLFLLGILELVFSQQFERIYDFSVSQDALSECIEKYLLKAENPSYTETVNVESIADLVAKRFSKRSLTKKSLNELANQVYSDLKYRKFRNQSLNKSLRLIIRAAVANCYQPHTDTPLYTPVFSDEPPEVGAVLDYILVDWQMLLSNMIQTRNGRTVLRRYAHEAGIRLEIALNSVRNHESFRFLLRSFWLVRAQRFYRQDGNRCPYFRHRYNMEHPFPHTYDNLDLWLSQRKDKLSDHNPEASYVDFNRIMYIHGTDNRGSSEIDVFSMYKQRGFMSQAEYYFEAHIDQFYRILFFFMELQIHGIATNEEDPYDGPLPEHVMPGVLQEILYNDYMYRHFLLFIRFGTHVTDNLQLPIDVNKPNSRVREEELFLLFRQLILRGNLNGGRGNATNIIPVMSTTPEYDHMKRKGSTCTNSKKKHFCQGPKVTTLNVEQQQYQNETCGYHGYVVYNREPDSYTNFTSKDFVKAMILQSKNCASISG